MDAIPFGLIAGQTKADLILASLQTGLQGYYRFKSASPYNDESPNGRHLEAVGTPGNETGLIDQCITNDATSGAVRAGSADDAIFDFGAGDFTISLWANWTLAASVQILLEKYTLNNGLTIYSFGTDMYLQANATVIATHSSVVTNGAWHYVVARRNGSTWSLFFNNTKVDGSNALTITDVTNPLRIMQSYNAGSFFIGKMDEVAIWNRALSDSNITYLYRGGLGRTLL